MTAQFESMKDIKERAAQYYKRDRRKFWRLYNWLCLEPIEKKGKQEQEFNADRLQSRTAQRRREILREFGPALTDLLGLDAPALEQAMKDADGNLWSGYSTVL